MDNRILTSVQIIMVQILRVGHLHQVLRSRGWNVRQKRIELTDLLMGERERE